MNSELQYNSFRANGWADAYKFSYNFDDECCILSNDFSIHSNINQEQRVIEDLEFDIEYEIPIEKIEDSHNIEISPNPISTCGNFPMPHFDSLDSQLDFITESKKKPVKGQPKIRKRGRKTAKQLQILIEELGNAKGVDKDAIKAVATKTGLTEVQVYKWYWDKKRKT